jgi:hypothetical protein
MEDKENAKLSPFQPPAPCHYINNLYKHSLNQQHSNAKQKNAKHLTSTQFPAKPETFSPPGFQA